MKALNAEKLKLDMVQRAKELALKNAKDLQLLKA